MSLMENINKYQSWLPAFDLLANQIDEEIFS